MISDPVFPGMVDSSQLGFAELTAPAFSQVSISPPGAVTITSPEDLDEVAVDTIVVEWNAVARADDYSIEIAEDEDFEVIFESNPNTEVEQYKNTEPLVDATDYYIRVRALNEWGAGAWSETVHITVALP